MLFLTYVPRVKNFPMFSIQLYLICCVDFVLLAATSCSILNSDDQNSNIVLTRASGTISSPEFPQGYPPNTECTWNIKLPNHNSIVNLTFTSFNIKDGVNPYCPVYHDRVEVFDGFASGGDPLGRFCAKSPPRGTMFSTGRHLAIVLSSKFEKGFSASYSSISQTGKHIASHLHLT